MAKHVWIKDEHGNDECFELGDYHGGPGCRECQQYFCQHGCYPRDFEHQECPASSDKLFDVDADGKGYIYFG